MNDAEAIIFVLLLLVTALAIYLVPSLVAYSRKKVNFTSILLLNILLGWTFLGWVLALIWAVRTDDEQKVIITNHVAQTPTPPPIPSASSTIEHQLLELDSLKEKSLISDDEYTAKRTQILS